MEEINAVVEHLLGEPCPLKTLSDLLSGTAVSAENISELENIINVLERYRNLEVNLATPISLLNHYINQFGSEYIKRQYYLNPYPEKLGLQNYI